MVRTLVAGAVVQTPRPDTKLALANKPFAENRSQMSTMTINGRVAPLPDDPDALLIDVVRDDSRADRNEARVRRRRLRRLHRAGGRRAGGELPDAGARAGG